jgi:fructose-1,6-bisphosphatase/inositol monophosphatase family enzyme
MAQLAAEEEIRALAVAESLGRLALGMLEGARPLEVRIKSGSELVTSLDLEIEATVRAVLTQEFPSHQIVGEELGGRADDPRAPTWWLDPLDGTTNFVHGLPWFSFSLALSDRRGCVVGVVADPLRHSVTSARKSFGATCDGEPVHCSTADTPLGQVIFAEWDERGPSLQALEAARGLAAMGCWLRVMGSSALSLVSAAMGKGSACVIRGFETVDILAACVIAREAGMLVVDSDGRETEIPEHGMVAVAPAIAKGCLPLLTKMAQ